MSPGMLACSGTTVLNPRTPWDRERSFSNRGASSNCAGPKRLGLVLALYAASESAGIFVEAHGAPNSDGMGYSTNS